MQGDSTEDSAVNETVSSKGFKSFLEKFCSSLTLDEAQQILEENISNGLGDGALEFGQDFLQDDEFVYYGYPVRFAAIDALSHYLEANGFLAKNANRYEVVVDMMQQQFLEGLPHNKVHEMFTFVPRYLKATDPKFADDEACWVWPVVCAKRIDNTLIDPVKLDTTKQILEDLFRPVDCAPGTPHWFFGGHKFYDNHVAGSFHVRGLQAAVSVVVSAQQNVKEGTPQANDPNLPKE